MADSKKSKTIKKVSEIPNASVTIEVDETADKANTANEAVTINSPEENPQEVDESESSEGISWKKIILIMLFVVPIGFLVFGGFLYFSKNFNTNFLKKEPEKKLVLPEESSPTPTEEQVDKEAYEIEIQNGSGIAGEGARVKDLLEKAGFKISTVSNADNSDYSETIITVSEKIEEGFIDELTEILEERGTVGKVEKLAEGEDGEVIVILGNDLKEEAEPTPEE